MNRDKNHTLRRLAIEGTPNRSRWACSCGTTFGQLSVHDARRVWREHKAAPRCQGCEDAPVGTVVEHDDGCPKWGVA